MEMLDQLQPWVIRATLVISGFAAFAVVLVVVCARMERRRRTNNTIR